MTGRALIVPVRVDALEVTSHTTTAGPLADFSELPFHDGRRDVNPGRPYLAPVLGDTPFEEEAVRLAPGMHLHWTLPAALTRGRHRPAGDTPATERTVAGLDFPCVPNRWLVDIVEYERTATESVEHRDYGRWIIESDYVHPEGAVGPAVSYLLPPEERARLGGHAPFRRLGRQVPLAEWREGDPDARHLDGLTAVGWGHPLFHAYHPSCSTVFGFHLATRPGFDPRNAEFGVFGWYSDLRQDPIAELAAAHAGSDIPSLLGERFGWATAVDVDDPPDRLLCVGNWQGLARRDTTTDGGLDRIALGATGAEALAAMLADLHHEKAASLLPEGSDTRALYEEVVESIELGAQIDPERADAVAALRDARHDKEFVAVPGGQRWTIRARGPGGAADAAAAAPSAVPGAVPAAAVARLHRLDHRQRQRDRLERRGSGMREQLYAEWCAYLECKYPPRGSRLERPDVDELRRHIEVRSLAALEANAAEIAALSRDLAGEAAELLADLADADVAACEITADDVRDWAGLARVALLPPAITAPLQADPDDEQARGAALDVLRAMVSGTLLPVEVVAARLGELPPWLVSPVDEPAVNAGRRAAAALLPDDEEAARQWLGAALAHVVTVRLAQRNRAVLELELDGLIPVAGRSRHELDLRPGPRFWQPRDPVLVLSGPAVSGSPRHARDAEIVCGVAALGNDPATAIVTALSRVSTLPAGLLMQAVIVAVMSHKNVRDVDWHPLMLDWKVALYDEVRLPGPDAELAGRERYRYRPDHLLGRYGLQGDDPDVVPHDTGDLTGPRRVSMVTGRSMLTPHPARSLRAVLADGPGAHPRPTFADRVRADATDDLDEDSGTGVAVMAASLSGFHDALRMCEPAFPIGIEDPLGSVAARAFAARVATAVGHHETAAPRPLLPFMPLRAGRMQLVDLQLVDSFGQVRGGLLDGGRVVGSTALPASRVAAASGEVPVWGLPPRLLQPARLQLRWLAAGSGRDETDESHDHPSTGPVCGWLVPDILDGVLTVHGADGTAIGSVDLPGRWRPAPGRDRIVAPEDVDDPGLRRLVVHLLGRAPDERKRLLEVLLAALDRVEPDTHGQHNALGLLMGRPVAVVRASVRLELLGEPPVDHGWPALRAAMAGHPRSDAGLRDVLFPLRLGEHHRLDDGLLAFWTETPGPGGPDLDELLRTPVTVVDEGESDEETLLVLTPDAPAVTLTTLVDPRAAVHATTGVLPTKVLRIPPEQYGRALHDLGITVRTAPVVTDPDTLRVALPTVPGYTWTWLERTGPDWQVLPAPAAPRTDAALAGPQSLRDGWLRLAPQDAP